MFVSCGDGGRGAGGQQSESIPLCSTSEARPRPLVLCSTCSPSNQVKLWLIESVDLMRRQ